MNDSSDVHAPKIVPYRYREYPRMLYKEKLTCVVKNDDECNAKLAKGWEFEPQALPSAADLDAVASEQDIKRGPGRPKKEVS
jgi:hypothetical protein